MKKLHLLPIIGILGVLFIPEIVFAQNINTDTTSTTIGSTQFGVVLSESDLQTIMQSSVALTCSGPTDARICTPAGNGTSTAFVRVNQLPGSFTDSPTGTVSSFAQPNFACGATNGLSDGCIILNGAFDNQDPSQTAPGGFGGTGANQLVGDINTNINIGDGGATAGMPDGFLAFTLSPAVSGGSSATIDQFIDHSIDLGGGSLMVFQQRDATIGAGNIIPDTAMAGGALTLVAFSTTFPNLSQQVPFADIGLVSRTRINQGPADGFGALNLDGTFNFPASINNAGLGLTPGIGFPDVGQFVTPGLNTGINGPDFGPEFNGFAFP